jgi:benzoate-CoA ligase
MAPLNLAEALLKSGRGGERVALREPYRQVTYAELADTVARLAGGLRALGVVRKDRVAIWLPDGLEAASSLLAVMHAGAIAVPLSELLRPHDVRSFLLDSGAAAIVAHASFLPALAEIRAEVPALKQVIIVGRDPADGEPPVGHDFAALVTGSQPVAAAPTAGTDTALILYTTAPSARPRGVQHAHETPLAAARAFAQILPMTAEDRVFCVARVTTAYGLGAGLVFPLLAGAEAICLPEQPHSQPVFDVVAACKPTLCFATPTLYAQLLEDLAGSTRRLDSLRVCVSGGESLPGPLVARMRAQLGVEVLGGYGLTEAFHFVIATRPGVLRPGSAGQVVPGFMLRVVDGDGKAVPPNEIGTLEIAGPTIMKGYWNRVEDTKVTFRNGWLRTADRFMVDTEGHYVHCGRTDDLFKVSGRWVSPAEVEATLLQHPAVWECAVVGVEDAEGLTKPLAYVVPNIDHKPSPALETELIEYVKHAIAPYKFPRWVEFIDQLPKGTGGKVIRYKLARRRPARKAHTIPPGYERA